MYTAIPGCPWLLSHSAASPMLARRKIPAMAGMNEATAANTPVGPSSFAMAVAESPPDDPRVWA